MTKSHILNRKSAMPRQVSIGMRLLSALLLGLALAASAFAQGVNETRITTILPTSLECKAYDENSKSWQTVPDRSTTLTITDVGGDNKKSACYLGFSITSLPADAKIIEAVLRLVRTPTQPNPSNIVINVASVPTGDWTSNLATYEDQDQKFFLFTIRSRTEAVDTGTTLSPSTDTSGNLLRPEANRQYIGLLLSPQKSGSGRSYFPPNNNDTSYTAGNQPRLILKYTVPRAAPPRSPASQSDGWTAMRSPKAFMPDPNTPPQNNYKPIQVFDGTRISSYKAATFGGLNHVVQKYGTEWRVDARDVFGNVVWSKPLPTGLTDDKTRVVVNGAGRLTIVSQTRFISYQLNAGDPRQQPSAPLTDKVVSGVKAPTTLLSGADGGLYVIGDGDLYALNPDLQMLWRIGVGTSDDARMTLGPDGQYVYATGFLPAGKGLLAINAQSGTAPPLLAFSSETKNFHNPVVIKHPDGADYIYIAANDQKSGVLRTLKNTPKSVNGDRVASLSQVKEETGIFSQPAPDGTALGRDLSSKKLYVVRREDQTTARLIPINAQTGALETSLASPAFVVAKESELWSGGNLAMDKNGNIFFRENKIFYGYGAATEVKQLFAQVLDLPISMEVLFGSDGTFYFQDQVGSLWASIPSYQLVNAQGVSISSPTHLRVEGTVDKAEKETTLSAGGNVTLGGEFKVNPGATLRVRTNVPPQ